MSEWFFAGVYLAVGIAGFLVAATLLVGALYVVALPFVAVWVWLETRLDKWAGR